MGNVEFSEFSCEFAITHNLLKSMVPPAGLEPAHMV